MFQQFSASARTKKRTGPGDNQTKSIILNIYIYSINGTKVVATKMLTADNQTKSIISCLSNIISYIM